MSLGPGQIDPRDTFAGYYKGINIYGHADVPTYYFFWGGVLFDDFNSQLGAEVKIDELSRTGLGDASPVDVVAPEGTPPPIETYRGVPIYQGSYGIMGGGTGYYRYFYYKGIAYSDFAGSLSYTPDLHAKIDELLATQPYIPPEQPPYEPPTPTPPTPTPSEVSVPSGQGWWGDVLTWFGNLWQSISQADRDAREQAATRSIAETRNISLEQAATIRETTKEAYKPAGLGGWLWGGLSESMGELVKNSMNEALQEVVRIAPEATGHSPEEKQKLDAALEPYAAGIANAILSEMSPEKYAHSPITPEEAKNSLNLIMGGVVGVEIGLFVAHAFLEGATLGQVEALAQIENMVISKLGVTQIVSSAVTIPLTELVLKRAQQYYAAEYTPEIPSYQDLIEMVVKEVIPLDEFKRQMKYLGYNEEWSQRIWDKHFIPPSLTDILTAWRRGLIDEKRVDELMILVDLDPRFKQIFDTRKYVDPPLSMIRFMFETGNIDAATVKALIHLQGYRLEHEDMITNYITEFQSRLWRRRYLVSLSQGFQKGVYTQAQLEQAVAEAEYTPDVAKYIVANALVRRQIAESGVSAEKPKLLSVADLKKAYTENMISRDVLATELAVRGYPLDQADLMLKLLDLAKVVESAGGSKVALSQAELVDAWKYQEITEDQLRTELQLRGLSLAEVEILIRTKLKKWGVGGQEAP